MKRSWIAGSVFSLAGIAAQDRQPVQELRVTARPFTLSSSTLRVQTDLVEVGVVVRGRDGHAIAGLKREDFSLTDQGVPREISTFSVQASLSTANLAPGASGAAPSLGPSSIASQQPSTTGAPVAPRFIALYFDDLSTSVSELKPAQAAARRFVNESLQPGDRIGVFAPSGVLLNFTADQSQLIEAIGKVKTHPQASQMNQISCPRVTPYQAYLIFELHDPTALLAARDETTACSANALNANPSEMLGRMPDASKADINPLTQMVESAARQTWSQARIGSQMILDGIGGALNSLSYMRGRRVLLLVSSGFISATLERERDQLVNRALRSGIVINSLDAKGLRVDSPSGNVDDSSIGGALPSTTYNFEATAGGNAASLNIDAMTVLAAGTGGLFFRDNNDLLGGLRLLGAAPEVSYMLGFHRGDKDAADNKYHKLKVSLAESGGKYAIQARPGYFAVPSETKPGAADPMERAVASGSGSEDFPVDVKALQSPSQKAGSVAIQVVIHVSIGDLQFPRKDDRRVQQFKLVAALMDAEGNFVLGEEGTLDFALIESTYTRLAAAGIKAALNLEAPPGAYRLRGVVRESIDGKMASFNQALEVK